MRYLILIFLPLMLFAQKDGMMVVITGTFSDQFKPEMLRAGVEEELTARYQLIDIETQKLALKEQEKQQKSGCYDDQCLVKVGVWLRQNTSLQSI